LAFCFLFHLSKLVQKLWNFLWCFIGRARDFTNNFWKILKDLLNKILICEIFFFSKFFGLVFVFYFFIIFHTLFSISSICTCQQILEIFMFFLFYGIEILSKNFGKSWNSFLKNIDIWNRKFFINSIVYYLCCLFFQHFGNLFFLFHLSKLVKKILNIFVVLYCTDYRIYQWILENSWIFIKKNRDTLNTKNFKNSIVYYLLF